jgi:hypothetical protein
MQALRLPALPLQPPAGGDSMFLRNVGIDLQIHKAPEPKTSTSYLLVNSHIFTAFWLKHRHAFFTASLFFHDAVTNKKLLRAHTLLSFSFVSSPFYYFFVALTLLAAGEAFVEPTGLYVWCRDCLRDESSDGRPFCRLRKKGISLAREFFVRRRGYSCR